jgi:predicted nucleotidyltransferase
MSQQPTLRKQHIEWLRRSSTKPRSSDEKRLARAWEIARAASQLLKEKYQVSRVRIFGSAIQSYQFHQDSDIDLAVEGLAISDYWDALADLLFLDKEIAVDLVDPDTCPPNIWAIVEGEGIEL